MIELKQLLFENYRQAYTDQKILSEQFKFKFELIEKRLSNKYNVIITSKGHAQAKIIKISVILFWLFNLTI